MRPHPADQILTNQGEMPSRARSELGEDWGKHIWQFHLNRMTAHDPFEMKMRYRQPRPGMARHHIGAETYARWKQKTCR